MPLTAKGEEIRTALEKEYGTQRGTQILYAGKNKGTFSVIDSVGTYLDAVRRGDAEAMKRCFKSEG